MRRLAVIALVAALAPARADDPKPIEIKLHRAPASTSALRYRLLPELRDMQSGNAVVHYLRAMSPEVATLNYKEEAVKRVSDMLEAPLDKLKGAQVEGINSGVRMLEDGSRCTHCDWEMLERARRDGLGLLLPEVQGMRNSARRLALRARLSIAEGRFDDAHRDLRTNLALGRHVAQGVTLIQCLVGVAISNSNLDQIEAWISQPAAPNLYWPLTDLPTPFIDVRQGLEGERFFLESIVPNYRSARPGVFSFDKEAFDRFVQFVRTEPEENPEHKALLEILTNPEKGHSAAKEYMARRGWSQSQVAALPVLHAVVLHQLYECERLYEDFVKILNLPPPLVRQSIDKFAEELKPGPQRSIGLTMAAALLPPLGKVYGAHLRTDRRIAALRTIEAVRLHVTEKGKLPQRLDEITAVPVPVDSLTGKPFEYRMDGGKARLIVPPVATGQRIEYVLAMP